MRRSTTAILVFAAMLALAAVTQAALRESESYHVQKEVLDTGGGTVAGTGYVLEFALADPSPIGTASGAGYVLHSGYLGGGGGVCGGGCLIEDECYAPLDRNPEDACEICDVSQNASDWSWNDECSTFSVPIEAGYNFLGRAVTQPKIAWASDVAADIEAQGGVVYEVDVWNAASGTWRVYDPTFPIDNFVIEPTDGFIVRAGVDSTWQFDGLTQMDGAQRVSSINGYTLVAVPADDYAMVSELVGAMNAAGCAVTEMSRWLTASGTWEPYDPSFPIYDFALDRVTGYFVRGMGQCAFDVNP